MARGHAFWVIVTGTAPTACRARRKEDLLPTLHQLQRTHPDAVVRWFDRGKLWASPIDAREALVSARGRRKQDGRNRDWRPGGSHVDPRARFKRTRDEKRAQFKRRLVTGRRRPQEEEERPTDPSTARPPERQFRRSPARKRPPPRGKPR